MFEKLQSIKNLTVPKTTEEIRQMLGLTAYYWNNYSCIFRPSTTINTTDSQNHSLFMDGSVPRSFWDAEECSYEGPYLGVPESPKNTLYLQTPM